MRPTYTCQRCLGFMGKPGLGRRLRSAGPAADIRRVFISTQVNQANSTRSRKALTIPSKSHRSISSLESQGGGAKSEPLEAPSPVSLNRPPGTEESTRVLLRPHNLFHRFSESPSPSIRRRAAFIKQHAYCPHPDHHRSGGGQDGPEVRKSADASQPPLHVSFECADCGIPVYCSEEHWADDFENHLEICDTFRQINEDDHDLRSGRFFPEFEYPGPQLEEAQVNMTNWDTFLYSREFEAINSERSMRQVTRLLTYPVTIGSFLHELSPYSIRNGGRLTTEGLKSLSGLLGPFLRFLFEILTLYPKALRYTLHPPRSGAGLDIKGLRPSAPPARIFILGARAESSLPREVWIQLSHMFPRGIFHLIFIGPESMTNRDSEFPLPKRTPGNPFGAIVEDRISHQLKISTFVEYYHTLHKAGIFQPYDPYFDCFVLFHPGLGHPASSHEWEETVPQLLETKVPVLVTGYTEWDMQRDLKWVQEKVGGEVDLLLEPGENRFRSLRWDLNDLDPQDISCGNWGVWSFRGKRYETTRKHAE
ncbi:MAG: translational activator for mitochondrial COX1 [Geoglossum umbratile]|nr:MAG: translational activator for mitochondrial COX1 [Geoglossum umbratile]